MKKRTKKLLVAWGPTARAKVFRFFFLEKKRLLFLLFLAAQAPAPELPVIALEADPAGACPLGIEPYDTWCVGLGGGLTQTDGTPLPMNALRLPAAGILGRTVVGPDRSALGRIVNVLVDAHGQALAVVIDFGGFMGVGSRTVAVEWALLSFPPPGSADDIVLGLDDAAINATPAYDGSDEAVVIGPSPPEPLVAAKPEAVAAKPAASPPESPEAVDQAQTPPAANPSRSDRPPPMLPGPGDGGSASKVGAGP